MREILFKAKRIDNGEWVEGLIWKKKYNANKVFISCFPDKDDNEEVYVVDSNTICQYTGLTDKNGNKIWENDVVSFNHSRLRRILSVDVFGFPDFEMAEYKRNYAIEFVNTYNHYGLRFRNKSIHFPCKRSTLRMHGVEVIGNIFDNPKLLEAGEA